ncbi:MAG: ABC transporter ATP-binding protein [Bacteroidia bacterium]
MTEIFTVENLKKKFNRSGFQLSVDQLSLLAGSITGVVGENGNGKTTLLDIIAGETKANGQFHYFGIEANSHTNWLELKNNIGFIPQRIPRWYGTLEQNLVIKAALEGISAGNIDGELDKLLDFLGLQEYRKLNWTEISTGYRLRFELARILIGNPRLLVLDEPLANLDINTQQKFLSDLKKLLAKKDYPLAVILSSQQLHEIESVADQMLFIKKGEVLYNGNLANISLDEEHVYELQLNDRDGHDTETYFDSMGYKVCIVGPYYQITTKQSVSIFLKTLSDNDMEIKYFRNLSNSTKRFFNN